ncbi:hypothetical protein EDD11_005579 [Mortierella claussenii]|nr:hypothetical protein EDD11_005579 [Mortierella claussenii]
MFSTPSPQCNNSDDGDVLFAPFFSASSPSRDEATPATLSHKPGTPQRSSKRKSPLRTPIRHSPKKYRWIQGIRPQSKTSPQEETYRVDISPHILDYFSADVFPDVQQITHTQVALISFTEASRSVGWTARLASLKHDGKTIAGNELRVIARAYIQLTKVAPPTIQDWFRSLDPLKERSRLQKLIGLGDNTCRSAINLAEGLEVKVGIRTGRLVKVMEPAYAEKLVSVAEKPNQKGLPNFGKRITSVMRKAGFTRSSRSILRDLDKLDMYWRKGIRQDINSMLDVPQNVDLRLFHLKQRLFNLQKVNGKDIPIRPDETYCHLDHAATNRRVKRKESVVCEPGRKRLLVILTAFVVYFDKELGDVRGRFVKSSVHIWPAIGKVHVPGEKRSAKADEDAKLWQQSLDEIRAAGIVYTNNDHQGHVTAELFEKLFTRLCTSLNSMGLGPCNIHMDGVSYHSRKLHKKPTSNDNKEEFVQWLREGTHDIPEPLPGKSMTTKTQLQEAVNSEVPISP